MKDIIFLLFVYSGMNLFAQQMDSNDELVYLDSENKTTNKDLAVYYQFKIPNKDVGFKIQKYFIKNSSEAQLVEKFYKDAEGLKQGKYESFSNYGENEQSGYYLNDLKLGNWKLFKSDFIPNYSSHQQGKLVHYFKGNYMYQDNLKNGPFKEFHENGAILAEGFYKNDGLVNECKWYFKSGGLSSLEKYDGSGALLNIEQWNEDGTDYTGEKLITKGPIFDKENVSNRLSEKIRNNFNISLINLKDIDSNLIVSCYINEEGNISSIDIKFH